MLPGEAGNQVSLVQLSIWSAGRLKKIDKTDPPTEQIVVD